MKVMTIFGTRPEAIKMAPVVRALKERPSFQPVVTVTAQHRDMLDQVLNLFHIRPDYDLDLMRPGQELHLLTARILERLAPILEADRPDWVLVHGDTTTTMAAAMVAFYYKVPVGHVEAGLRTDDPMLPYPEEMNRRLTTRLATLHFAPTERARRNLLAERVPADRVHVTGNTVIDALLHVAEQDAEPPAALREAWNAGRLILMTTHRRENWGEPLERVYGAILDVLDRVPGTAVVFPCHPNPRVRESAERLLGRHPRVYVTEPLDYGPFVQVMKRADLVISDSGGVQEEAPSLGVPVLVLREATERPEAVEAGTVKLVGTDPAEIAGTAAELLTDRKAHAAMAEAKNPFGDGEAAARIVGALARFESAERDVSSGRAAEGGGEPHGEQAEAPTKPAGK